MHKGLEGKMIQKHSASDINLQGTLFMIRAFFGVTTAATTIARVLFVCPAGIVIFRRGFWR
jgi:hypothetical protein